jgi:site-specific DNA recombinase
MRRNDAGEWIYPGTLTHEPIVTNELFGRARTIAAAGRGRHVVRKRRPSPRAFALRGLISCAICGRLMQGSYNHGLAHYRCRYPSEYAVVNEVDHPRNVYLREDAVVGPLDGWLAQVFDPANIDETLESLQAASESNSDADVVKAGAARKRLAECDKRLTRYRAALDSGADLAVVTTWIAEVQAERLAAEVELDRATGHNHGRLSRDQLAALVNGLGNLLDVLAKAAREDKAEVYRQLGLRLTYDPARRVVIAESDPWPNVGVGGPIGPKHPPAGAAASVGQSQCRRADPYSTPTVVLRTELALAG